MELGASAKEAIDRATRYNIARNGTPTELQTNDFVEAAEGLYGQIALMDRAAETADRPEIERALGTVAEDAVRGVLSKATLEDLESEYESHRVVVPNGNH